MADDFFFQSDSSEGQQPIAPKEHSKAHFYRDDMANCSNTLLKKKAENALLVEVENISLVEFDDNFMHSPENHEDLCHKNPSVSDLIEYDSPLSSEDPGHADAKVPPTPMNSLVESSPLDNGPPTFFPEDVIEKINEIGATDISQVKYAYWWNGGEPTLTQEALLNADTWSSSEQESVFHSPDSLKDQKPKGNHETRNSAASFQIIGSSSHRLNKIDNHDKNTRQESKTFSDLWNSNQSLQATSDPWRGSPDKFGQCVNEPIVTWDTTHGDNHGRYFAKVNEVDEITSDHSSEDNIEIDKENTPEQQIFEGNNYIKKTGGIQNPNLKGICADSDASTDLRHIQRNLCVWDLYEGNEEKNAIDWEDPFLSYRCLNFTTPSTSKECIVSPPDTNYSTSDSISSPIYEDDIKEIEKTVEEQKQFESVDGHLFVANNQEVKLNDRYSSNTENINYNIETKESLGLSRSLDKMDRVDFTIEERSKMNNQKPCSWHDYSPEYRESDNLIQRNKDLPTEISDCLESLSKAGSDHTFQLSFANSDSSYYQSNLLACTSTCSPPNKLSDDVALSNHDQSAISNTDGKVSIIAAADHISTKLPNMKPLSPDIPNKVINVFTELQYKAVSSQQNTDHTQENYEGHVINNSGENEDTWGTDLQYDTESSSLNTPDDLDSFSSSNFQNVNLLNKSPVSSIRGEYDEFDTTVDCVIHLSPVDDTRLQTNNEDINSLTQSSCSFSPEINNSYKSPIYEKSLHTEKECITRKIPIKENILCSGMSCKTPINPTNLAVGDTIAHEGMLNNSHNNSEHAEHELKINFCNEENILSGSSHSSSTSPELADSWATLQEGMAGTNKAEDFPVSQNNEQNCIISQFDTNGHTRLDAISKVPMNLDIWNTQICEDLESSSSSPESNDILDHSGSLDRNTKNCFQQKLLDLDTSGSTLFNETQSSSTTPITEEESLEDQLDGFHDYPSEENNIMEHRNACFIPHADNQQESLLYQDSLAHLSCYLLTKSQSNDSACDVDNTLANTRDGRTKLSETEDNEDEITRLYTLDSLNPEQQDETLERSHIDGLSHIKFYQTNFPTRDSEIADTMKFVSSSGEFPTPNNCYEDISAIENSFNSPVNNAGSNTENIRSSQPLPLENCNLNNHLDGLDNLTADCNIRVQNTVSPLYTNTQNHTLAELDNLCIPPSDMDVQTETKLSDDARATPEQIYLSICSVHGDGSSSEDSGQHNDAISSVEHCEGLTAADALYSEYLPDILDDHTQQSSPFLCVDPDLWNMTEKHYSKISVSDSPDVLHSYDNSSNASNSPDLCREYENDETYRQDLNIWTDYNPRVRAQSGSTNERQSNAHEEGHRAEIEMSYSHISFTCPGKPRQTINTIQKSDSLSIYKKVCDSEILSNVQIDTVKCNGDSINRGQSSSTEKHELESPNMVQGHKHNFNSEGAESPEQNVPVQTTDTHRKEGEMLLNPLVEIKQAGRETQFTDEGMWSNYTSPAGGDTGPCNESPGLHIPVCKDDIQECLTKVGNNMDVGNSAVDQADNSSLETGLSSVVASESKINTFPFRDIRVVSLSDTVSSVESPDTFQSISMTNGSEDQTTHVSGFHSFHLEEESSFILPQRLESKKKSEEISEHEHSWSIILSQTEASESSPEDIFSKTETGDCDKDLEDILYDGYEKQDQYPKAIKDNDYIDLEESFELCKLEETVTKLDAATTSSFISHEEGMQLQFPPAGGACAKQLAEQRNDIDNQYLPLAGLQDGLMQSILLDDVGMDIPYDAAEIRPEPPNSLDLNGSQARKIKLTAPNINLSLDHSEGSILSDDNLDTPDELDINVDDLDTPDEADSFDYTGNDDRPALGHTVQEDFESIQEYTAEEERADNRLWRTVIIGEQEQRINMKIIEPYTKVISHGGYYGEGISAIIVFAACFLPDSSRADYNYVMENLFLYVISTLELMVAEDYMIVYLNGATPRRKMPGLGWMKKCYQMIDRRLRKNLKSFIIVHPSWFIRTILAVTRPFISSKFSSKIKYVSSLAELRELIPMEYVQIPESIVKYEETRCFPRNMRAGCLPMEPEMTSLDQQFEKKTEDNV
ncbi:uncharacterized protein LOC142155213 isoform X3 [Mixophyes fleayi]|uniref:uncharacterized protein LOC142155213 isoform X3 n=1 Tax=Mixophyes fleayi TaxID=3061075 RepID=UPI003F4DA984